MFAYIYSLLIKKDIFDSRNISMKLLYVCVCLGLEISSFFSKFPLSFPIFNVNLCNEFISDMGTGDSAARMEQSDVDTTEAVAGPSQETPNRSSGRSY